MTTRRFELSDANSSKFWEISEEGSEVTVRFGRIGTTGQEKTKELGSASATAAEVARLVREKTNKGYVEDGETAGSASASNEASAAAAKPEATAEESETVTAALKALDDIKEWLADQGASEIVASLNAPITPGELNAAEKELGYPIPEELRAVYRRHNGQNNWSELSNTFFPHGIGGFCDLAAAVRRDEWRRFIGPSSLERHPEQMVERAGFQVDSKSTSSELRPEECSTAWLVFAWEETFAGVLHLRTGRVFAWEKDTGLTFMAESFGAFLIQLADDLWKDKHQLARDEFDDGEEGAPWIWQ